MKALRWNLLRQWQRLGWAAFAALGIALACAVFYVTWLQPKQSQLAALRAERNAARGAQQGLRNAPMLDSASDLAKFYQRMPKSPDATTLIGRIYAAAAAQGLMLEHGDYQMSAIAGSQLVRFDIELPVRGPYPQVRRFVAGAMQDVPTLALKSLSFSRQKIDDPGVDAHIVMTLYVQKVDG